MNIFLLLLNFNIFLLAIFICFYVPGKVLVAYCKLPVVSLEKYVFPLAFGFTAFTLVCYILDICHMFFLIYPILLLCLALFLKNKLWAWSLLDKQDRIALGIILFLALLFVYPTIFSGLYADGIHLISINATDGTFHMSLIHELQHHFPPDHPGFAGGKLSGYHIFADYVWAKVLQIFPIPILFLFFQYEPLFLALLWGTGVYLLIKRWAKSVSAGVWAVFLTQFGGSFVFLAYFWGHTKINLNNGFGMLQSAVSLINPPFSTSIVVIVFGLFSLLLYLQTKEKKWIFPLILFFGMGAEFKVYAGIVLLGGFSLFVLKNCLLFCHLFFRKKILHQNVLQSQIRGHFFVVLTNLGILLGILSIFFLTYMQLSGKGGFLIYYPYWAPIEVIRSNFPFMNYDNQLYVYGQFHMIHRIIWLHIRIFILFFFGNLGARAVGWCLLYFYPKKKAFFLSEFTFVLFCMMMLAFFIPLFFIQSIKPFEITQMFNYFLFFGALFGAVGCASLFASRLPKLAKVGIFIGIIVITIPSNMAVYSDYFPIQPPKVSKPTYQAITFLQHQATYDATVLFLPQLTDPNVFSKVDSWVHSTNMMMPSLVDKRSFFTDENITYPDDLNNRVSLLSQLATLEYIPLAQSGNTQLHQGIIEKLASNHIAFIYSWYQLPSTEPIHIQQIYAAKNAYIYKVLYNTKK